MTVIYFICHICSQLLKCRFCKFARLQFCSLLLYLLDQLIGKCPDKCAEFGFSERQVS